MPSEPIHHSGFASLEARMANQAPCAGLAEPNQLKHHHFARLKQWCRYPATDREPRACYRKLGEAAI